MSASLKLAQNEELLPDGRILIRGTLRPDGTRRPDRIKKAKFLNDEDLERNKYLTPGARRRLKQQQKQSLNHHKSQTPTSNGKESNNAIDTRTIVQSVVSDIIRNAKSTSNSKKRKRVQIDFNEDVLQPLIHDMYGGDESALIEETTTSLCRDTKQCQQWIEDKSLRSEVIKYLHLMLSESKMKKRAINGHSQKIKDSKSDQNQAIVRGKGTVSYGSGKLLSEQIEMKTNGHCNDSLDEEEHKKDSESNKSNNNTKGDEFRDKANLTDLEEMESRESKLKRLHQECREIRELEDRKANGDSLNEEQMARIDCKEDVLNMLMNLRLNVPK